MDKLKIKNVIRLIKQRFSTCKPSLAEGTLLWNTNLTLDLYINTSKKTIFTTHPTRRQCQIDSPHGIQKGTSPKSEAEGELVDWKIRKVLLGAKPGLDGAAARTSRHASHGASSLEENDEKLNICNKCHEETKKQFRTIWFRLSQYPFCLHYWAYSYTLLALPRHHSWLYLVDHENGNRLYRKLIKNTLEASLRLLNHSINGKVPWH